ncbi:ROK family protein [Photobacterium sp. DNB23_23_1]
MYKIGLDVGGTKISAALFDAENRVIHRQRYSTDKSSYENFIGQILAVIEAFKTEAGDKALVGIGLPGAIDGESGVVKNCNCQVVNGHNLEEDLANHLGHQVHIANDADCFALGEACYGAGEGKQVVFGIVLGTGCGGGLVINQTLVRGPNRLTGEWGHNPLPGYDLEIDGNVDPCYCGRAHCIESFLSGTGIAKRFATTYGEALSAADIFKHIDHRADCSSFYRLYVDQLARALASIINLIDPDMIVVGGGLSKQSRIFEDLPTVLPKYVFGGKCNTLVLPAKLGDDCGIYGAVKVGSQCS